MSQLVPKFKQKEESGVIWGCKVHFPRQSGLLVWVENGKAMINGTHIKVPRGLIYIPMNLSNEERLDWIALDDKGHIVRTSEPAMSALLLAEIIVSPNPGLVTHIQDRRHLIPTKSA